MDILFEYRINFGLSFDFSLRGNFRTLTFSFLEDENLLFCFTTRV